MAYISLTPYTIPRESWHWFNSDSFANLYEYYKLGIPAILMTSTEWWSFEILALLSGWISPVDLAANSVILNVSLLLFNISYGISCSSTNLVGNSLGERKPVTAKIY